jgi:hypothetical protein
VFSHVGLLDPKMKRIEPGARIAKAYFGQSLPSLGENVLGVAR